MLHKSTTNILLFLDKFVICKLVMHLPALSVTVTTIGGIYALLALPCYAGASNQDLYQHSGRSAVNQNYKLLQTRNVTIAGASGNSSLAEALKVVAAVQSESQQRNARLLANPRKNEYVLYNDRARPSGLLEGNGTVSKSVFDGTGVNATIGAALALVAEASAKNKTAVRLAKASGAGSYWMANIEQNGASPYAPAGYKVTYVLSTTVSLTATNMFRIGLA